MDSLVPRDEYVALRHCVYLNQAALGLIPATSVSAMVRFLAEVAQLGNLRLSDDAEVVVLDDVRRAAAQLLDVPPGWVAITGGASEVLGQVAALIAQSEGSVLLVSSDFPSVTYPWLVAVQRHGTAIKTVDDRADENLTESLIDAIDESTKVVCFGAVQYATGSRVDVAAVAERAHSVGARVVVDATQLAGAGPVSVRQWGADAVVCSGYKWLSSHGGVAVLTLAPDLVEMTPHLVGWKGTPQPFAFEPLSLPLAADARRFELSTIAYVSAIGLRESIAMLSGSTRYASSSTPTASPPSSSRGWSRSGGRRSVPLPIVPRAATSWRCRIRRCRPTTSNEGSPRTTTSSAAAATGRSASRCTSTTTTTTSPHSWKDCVASRR
jgi:cysteine desulfurase / selenocysteine lyase